jgi:hypothetical protein
MVVVVDMQREEGMEVVAGVEVLAEQECWVGEQETVYPQLHGSCGGPGRFAIFSNLVGMTRVTESAPRIANSLDENNGI